MSNCFQAITLPDLSDRQLKAAQESGPAGVFYHRALLEIWEKVYRWNGIVLTDGTALMIGFIKSSLLGKSFYSLPFGWYGGVINFQENSDFLKNVDSWLSSQGFWQESIVQFAAIHPVAFSQRLRTRTLATMILDLALPARYSENTERNVEKSKRGEFVVMSLSQEHQSQFFDIQIEHVDRTGEKRKLTSKFYEELFAIATRGNSGVEISGVFQNDRLLCSHIYFLTATDIFYFDGFSSQQALDSYANFLLFDHSIRQFRDEKRLRFNFGASPAGDTGLERFKEGWGCRKVQLNEFYRKSVGKRALDFLRGID